VGALPGLAAWAALLLLGIGAMHWGSGRCAAALAAWRGPAGLRAVAAGALLGIATAAPEISVNLASVGFGWPDLGLGAALGSNVPALPLVFALAWLSLRRAPEQPLVAAEARPVQAWPYLLVVLLLAALTLAPGQEGLQPLDALFLVLAYGAWLAHALLRPSAAERPAAPAPPGMRRAVLLGLPAIALGALASVTAAQRIGPALGLSELVVGLFVVGLLCALPESLSAWGLARQGRTTTAVATAMSDGIVSLTVALLPPALVGAAVGDRPLYVLNLFFLAAVLLAWMLTGGPRGADVLHGRRVALFAAGYLAYLAAAVWLLTR
jgi:cation:H+ antiporter